MAQCEAGGGAVADFNGDIKGGFGPLNGIGHRHRPDTDLIERQQRAGFKTGEIVFVHQLAGQQRAGKSAAVLVVVIAAQHAIPRQRKSRCPGDPFCQREMQQLAQDHKLQTRADKRRVGAGAGHQVHHRFGFPAGDFRQRPEAGVRVSANILFEQHAGGVALGLVRMTV